MPRFLDRVTAAVPDRLQRPVTVAITTVRHAIDDRIPGLAGEVAFWVLLSLPALVLSAIAAIGAVGSRTNGDWETQLINRVTEVASLTLTPRTIDDTIVPLIRQIIDDGGIGLVSISFLTALWTAARAIKVILQTVTIVADATPRKGWQDRLLGFGIALGAMVGGTVLAPLLLAGPNFGQAIDDWTPADLSLLSTVWTWLYWPVVIAGATVALVALYRVAVPRRDRRMPTLPGALLATGVWLAGSGGLRLYGVWFMGADSIYGSLAGPIVALLWLWLSGFAVLLGAELNAALRPTGDPAHHAVPESSPDRPVS